MKFQIDMHLNPEQISYVLCGYYRKYGQWPTKREAFAAVKSYVADNGEPSSDRVDDALNGAPILMAKASSEYVERYFPYSFD